MHAGVSELGFNVPFQHKHGYIRDDARRIDALDQWCLTTLLEIKWHQFVHNDEVRRITKQPNLTLIIQSRRLSILGHIARMDDDADAKMILTAPPPDNWKRPPWGVPVSRGWTPSSEIWLIWEPTTSHWTKQSTWPRTALCGGWCLRTRYGAIRTSSGACQKRRRRRRRRRSLEDYVCVKWRGPDRVVVVFTATMTVTCSCDK